MVNTVTVVKLIECITFIPPTDNVIEIAVERGTYSVVEGNDLEVCVTVLLQSEIIVNDFEVIADVM